MYAWVGQKTTLCESLLKRQALCLLLLLLGLGLVFETGSLVGLGLLLPAPSPEHSGLKHFLHGLWELNPGPLY